MVPPERRPVPLCLTFVDGDYVLESEAGEELWIDPPTPDQIETVAAVADPSAAGEVDSPLARQLRELGLGEPGSQAPRRIGCPLADAFMRYRRTANWHDYSRPDALEADSSLMAAYASESDPPEPAQKPAAGRPFARAVETEPLLEFLYWTFGEREPGRFHGFPVTFRHVPSFGARHGFEPLLALARPEGAGHEVFSYEAAQLRLQSAAADLAPVAGFAEEEDLLAISCLVDRYMWRYRHPLCYFYLFLDLGHVVQNLAYAGSFCGVGIGRGIPPPATLTDELRQPMLAAFVLERRQGPGSNTLSVAQGSRGGAEPPPRRSRRSSPPQARRGSSR